MVIPAYHSSSTIARTLGSLRSQSFADFETIVVDSSADDGTERAVRQGFPEVTLLRSPVRLYPHAARNLGVSHARGDILVFTDPDCRVGRRWLERLVAAVDAGHTVVGGSMDLEGRDRLELAVHLCKFFWLLPGLPAGERRVVCTASAAYARSVWEAVGPFRGDLFTADALLAMRAADAGYAPHFEPHAEVVHRHDGGCRHFLRQFEERGREFARGRSEQERWSRPRCACWVLAAPLILLVQLARAGRDAVRSGRAWTTDFLVSLPLHFCFRLAWTLGETRALGALAVRRARSVTDPATAR